MLHMKCLSAGTFIDTHTPSIVRNFKHTQSRCTVPTLKFGKRIYNKKTKKCTVLESESGHGLQINKKVGFNSKTHKFKHFYFLIYFIKHAHNFSPG